MTVFFAPADAGIGRTSAFGANRTRWDGGNDVNDPHRKSRWYSPPGVIEAFAYWQLMGERRIAARRLLLHR